MGSTDVVTRQALGRIAKLGHLYDATTDSFCKGSVFPNGLHEISSAISLTEIPNTKTSYSSASTLKERLASLRVEGGLQLSVLGGLVPLGGSGNYLNYEKTSFSSVERTLLCNVTTVAETIDFSNQEVQRHIYLGDLNETRATHVVTQIHWGGNCAITLTGSTNENESNNEKTGKAHVNVGRGQSESSSTNAEAENKSESKVGRYLDTLLQKMGSFSINAEAGLTKEERDSFNEISFEMVADVLTDSLDDLPNTVEGMCEIMKAFPKLIKNYNGGKGRPMEYVMCSLSNASFYQYTGSSMQNVVRVLSDVAGIENRRNTELNKLTIQDHAIAAFSFDVVNLHDDISRLGQKVHDQVEEIRRYSHVATSDTVDNAIYCERHLKRLKMEVGIEIAKHVQEIRSGRMELQELNDFCEKQKSNAERLFRNCDHIYQEILRRIIFAKRCERRGVQNMTSPFCERIAEACDEYETVIILIDGTADHDETLKGIREQFIQRVKGCQSETIAFFYAWSEENRDIRIEQYTNGNRVDVRPESKNLPQCDSMAYGLVPFTARCPDRNSGNCGGDDEQLWTCYNCQKTLQYCHPWHTAYCRCGHVLSDLLQFQRCSENRGHHVAKFSHDDIQNTLQKVTAGRIIKRISTYRALALGVTSLGDELFVLHAREVTVYSINELRLKRRFTADELNLSPEANILDIASDDNCLYLLTDHGVHKYDPNSGHLPIKQWKSASETFCHPRGLSVTLDGNVLVTDFPQGSKEGSLIKLSNSNGERVQESDIKLPIYEGVSARIRAIRRRQAETCDNLYGLRHAIELSTGQYIVVKRRHGVCLINDEGAVQSNTTDYQLNKAAHLAIDREFKYIFVADSGDKAIVRFTHELKFVDSIDHEISDPRGLHFHQATRRLFVADGLAGVVVIQFLPRGVAPL